jgi:hypothetical protein
MSPFFSSSSWTYTSNNNFFGGLEQKTPFTSSFSGQYSVPFLTLKRYARLQMVLLDFGKMKPYLVIS